MQNSIGWNSWYFALYFAFKCSASCASSSLTCNDLIFLAWLHRIASGGRHLLRVLCVLPGLEVRGGVWAESEVQGGQVHHWIGPSHQGQRLELVLFVHCVLQATLYLEYVILILPNPHLSYIPLRISLEILLLSLLLAIFTGILVYIYDRIWMRYLFRWWPIPIHTNRTFFALFQ